MKAKRRKRKSPEPFRVRQARIAAEFRYKRDHSVVVQVEKYIEAQLKTLTGKALRDSLRLEVIAQELGIGVQAMCNRFERGRSMPLEQYISERLLVWASQLLILTNLPVSAIVERYGCGLTHFYQIFKTTFGYSPERWRKLWRL